MGTTVWATWNTPKERKGPHPIIKKFQNPSAAEAICDALQHELNLHALDEGSDEYTRDEFEQVYLNALTTLGDKSILPRLKKHYLSTGQLRARLRYAGACAQLGDDKSVLEIASELKAGKLKLPVTEDKQYSHPPERETLNLLISTLSSVDVPAADDALWSLSDPANSLFPTAQEAVRTTYIHFERADVFRHPFCIAILRADLKDKSPTGFTISVEADGESYSRNGKLSFSNSGYVPKVIQDPKNRVNKAQERRCDFAAEAIGMLVTGIPAYNALLKKSDAVLKDIVTKINIDLKTLRIATPQEQQANGADNYHIMFIQNKKKP